jgi:hypothetical protein
MGSRWNCSLIDTLISMANSEKRNQRRKQVFGVIFGS